MKILLYLVFLLAPSAFGAPQMDRLSLELARLPFNRDYFFPDQKYWGEEVRLQWDVSWGRWSAQNFTTGRTYDGRFRYVGWEFDNCFMLVPGLDLIWHHHSQHALDMARPQFPVLDAYGLKLTFIGETK